ncbi:ATP-dependent helicase, partial [Mycobacterium tuberculosis]
MTQTAAPARYSPAELACALGLFPPTAEQAAVIAAPPGPLVVIAGAGAGKTETMAARVVWLVANGYAEPGQVLGLTFTRKAAGQLLRRVRSRLARLAGIGLGCGDPAACAPVVSTYHAFAGSLLRDYGLLLPLEPDTRLLSETELWQLAFDVVSGYDGVLCTDKSPAAVTSIVVRLWGQLGEHLVDTRALRDTHVELERLVHALPAGRYQRDRGPSQWLLRMLATQTQRAELVPLLDALGERMHAGKVMDFAMQMASAARLAATSPQVGQDLRRRYRVVLLDEYQDTGHAQRVVLSSLFGGGVDDGLALTAVGDPIQSIYGWRGASATNLPRFTTDFPLSDGTPAPVLELLTSWRNPPQALRVANGISAEARRRSVAVRALRPRPDAPPGAVRCALLPDVQAEREWIADHLRMRYQRAEADGVKPPTAAVLVRRNADAAAIADTLRARGIPAEVVGLAGLLSIPEVAEVVAMLRLVADPTAGAAAMRVLTGPRWRLGARDLAALWRRALTLSGESPSTASPESIAMAASADADNPCLADAISDPGSAEGYSVAGYGRIGALAGELSALRGRLGHSLPDLVAEVRRVLGVDCEVRASAPVSGGWAGPEHLDAFADVVAGYAERASARSSEASVAGLLAYLDVAEVVENGLPPAELTVACDRVQVLTVHAAKGLEWQVVAVAHLSRGVFPSTVSRSSWLTDPAELPPLLRGDR